MITPNDILTHAYNILPLVTDRFSEMVTPTAAIIDLDLNLSMTVPNTSAFIVGYSYPVPSITLTNPIVSAVGSSGAGWTITTLHPHRITKPMGVSDRKTFTLQDGAWPASVVTDVPSKTEIFARNGESANPTGDAVLEPLQGENGYLKLIAKTATTLKFELNTGYVYPCDCIVPSVQARLNLTIVPDIDRAAQVYAQDTNKLWAFIVMGDRDSVPNDNQQAGVVAEGKKNVDQVLVSTRFTIVVVWPRESGQESARKQLNEAYGSIYAALNGTFFGSRLGSVYRIAPVANGQAAIKDIAHYAHAYEYQALDRIDFTLDGITPEHQSYSVPVRFIDGEILVDCGQTEPQSIRFDVEIQGGV